ncbi:OsmC family protein [Streptomyces acidiscabies]|uniref:OsmC family protein n=1 Tax=Streptomyces acidiscabies TaxID=42234 RepID=UPI00073F263F|nr:OsmC family protein [Streptomyces acidiscabies]GAQ50350.1 OsmC-like protein [Streptomyces acidiscabies]GAV37253.1 OsmC-like protein [Streptomyces acidiscabies]
MNQLSPARDTDVLMPRRALAEPPGLIEVTHVANRAFALFVRDHELTVDQPVEEGGDNDGPTPLELFVSALASCAASDATRFLRLLDQPYEHLRVKADFTLADGPAPRITGIRLRVLPPTPLTAVLEQSLRAVVGRCAVHNSLCAPPGITVEIG